MSAVDQEADVATETCASKIASEDNLQGVAKWARVSFFSGAVIERSQALGNKISHACESVAEW